MIAKKTLSKLYIDEKLSMNQIAQQLNCSANKVVYWMDIYKISRRSISEAVYQKYHPFGDPFKIQPIRTKQDAELLGLGVGLYWGEGTKANKQSVRLGNSDPHLLNTFIKFLIERFGVKKQDLRFGLQIFTDIDKEEALNYWMKQLGVNFSQFYKPHITISNSIGNYRKKNRYGVVTIYYNNKKLRDILVSMLPR